MKDFVPEEISSDEKLMAGFAYFLGVIPALIIWGIKRRESQFIGFHAVQAAMYDGLVVLVAMLLIMIQFTGVVISAAVGILGVNLIADYIAPETPILFLIITIILTLFNVGCVSLMSLVLLGLSLVDLVAAYFAFNGRDWRYPFFANWAEKITPAVQPSS